MLPSEHKTLYYLCTTLAQRWSTIVQMLHKCFMFTRLAIYCRAKPKGLQSSIITCGWMSPSLFILKVILKVSKLKMGIYHPIPISIRIKFHYFELRHLWFCFADICRFYYLLLNQLLEMRIFNFENFANLFYMKLYTLKSKNNFKAPKKTESVLFPGRILPCKQNKSAIYSISCHIFPRLRRWDQYNHR